MSEEAKALDEARWAEAGRQAEWGSPTITKDKRQVNIYRRLVVEGWEPPVDPLLIEAREICAAIFVEDEFFSGNRDEGLEMGVALDALRRGMELATQDARHG